MDDLPDPFWKGKKREKETPLISYTQVYTEFARLNTKKLRKMFHLDMNFDT